MKTISGYCVSSKDISLSKAAKILSKFVSAENGASHAINAYLHRASAAFSELKQLHKEVKSSHSHKKKHRRPGTEEDNVDNGRVVEISVGNAKLTHDGSAVSKSKFKRRLEKNDDVNDEKSTQTAVEFDQELNGSLREHSRHSGSTEKHKKHKSKKQKI
ncbi:hypothetical protein HN51_017400 [Arachis hypogaea]|uniref:uncharacterized protein LOC107605507 n=1 Tax=Arachis ipaensis TaxID=130454 RepID=UPI0007AF73ED|nr:uncharacterized protein LOC107605507 [Arachis ipaensis]XP_016162888.1 uncharacterized protein LOC107605507 [Arachis ipaensis]XP_020960916.1 uncharacterized protein LOC107605507 [Arachis ipaensis]XP_025660047.1 uncharacterized protein LOC112755926 [Arachis hypogaea]XP_025660048.1 uncharacterized protein LOC112755926 [Arachis hypogaea]XP_025660049.1 uncharacterized protein LOC112755926 [Arachis hypogaea]XP_025660050.1 uncharacterized protein LOC112755926 [Arachis hypogaea]QHN88754.1 unchara